MQLWVLGSGSRGNAVLIREGSSTILIDAGFAPHVMLRRLRSVEIAPESIDGLVITHEHSDHVRGARVLCQRFGWKSYASRGTITAAGELRAADTVPFTAGESFSVGAFDMLSVRASHDAAEPVVLVATGQVTGARAGVAYDLGLITQSVRDAMRNLDVLVLEANHDVLMLQNGPYPASVRARIAGRSGHLSNKHAADLAREVSHRRLRHIVLAHLSESCNTAQTALKEVCAALSGGRFAGRVTAAQQDGIVGPFEPGLRESQPVQLRLGL